MATGSPSKETLGHFFVNAAGGKEEPVIIGHAVQPRCKRLKDRRPYGCYYFSNKKA